MRNGVKILVWLVVLVCFVYSYRAIMDLKAMHNLHRQESVIRMLTALSQPNIFEYEYGTRETPIVLDEDCRNFNDLSQVEQVGNGVVHIDLKCTTALGSIYAFRGSGFQPNTTGYVAWDVNHLSFDESFTNSTFYVDRKGNFSITVVPPYQVEAGAGQTIVVVEQISRTLIGFSKSSRQTAEKMWETMQIAFLATCISTILAILLTYISARPTSFWGRAVYVLLQILTAIVHAVHPLIVVIPAIVLVGIGPTAGVLTLTLFSTAILVIAFSEYAQQYKKLDWLALFIVHFPGLAFRRLSANLLIATILGFMGGGGIGFLIQQNLNLLNHRDASVAIIACIISISSLDLLSRIVWHKIQRDIPPVT